MKSFVKWRLLSAVLAFGGLLCAQAVSAAVMVTPSFTNTTAGTPVTVDVRINQLGSNPLGAFDIDLAYNPALLTPTGVTFGPALGDPLALEAFTDFSFATPGIVDFSELSLLSAAELGALQSADFSIATLSFDAIGSGPASFTILATSTLVDAFGNPVGLPEPGSMLLLALGIPGLMMARRRKA